MKANELRIGNWVFGVSYKKNIQFGAEHFTDYVGHVRGAYRPIPLTEEWLERFGAKYKSVFVASGINSDVDVWELGDLELIPTILGDICVSSLSGYCRNIQYVHQVQNLYFALTGEELEIKEKVK